jgi:UPF0755 protein
MARRRISRRAAAGGGLIALGLALLLALAAVWTYGGPGPKARAGAATTVVLAKGAGVRQISASLKEAGVISSGGLFTLAARATGAAGRLKAGEYQIPSGASMAQILSDIRAGRVVRHLISVPEGWTSGMAAEAVNAEPVLTGTAPEPPEGSILPDTYEVQRGEDRAAVIGRMRAAQTKLVGELWASRDPDLPFTTPEEAVTLASIVEKETGVAAERPRVAAVFINRLKAGMALQSDPTIIYGISKGRALGRGIKQSELDAPSPYNSYKVVGLPPTPIANPGRAALMAVLHPLKTDELYFVADGSGGHVFASTLEAHEKNVAAWRALEKQRAAAVPAGSR